MLTTSTFVSKCDDAEGTVLAAVLAAVLATVLAAVLASSCSRELSNTDHRLLGILWALLFNGSTVETAAVSTAADAEDGGRPMWMTSKPVASVGRTGCWSGSILWVVSCNYLMQ